MAPPGRRARAAVVRAATASMRALPLRRVLLVIVGVFVLLPLCVYNVATLDFSGVARASSHAFVRGAANASARASTHAHAQHSAPLPRCLNVSTATLLTADGRVRVQRECGAPPPSPNSSSTAATAATATPTESIVHFIHVPLHEVALLPGERAPASESVTFLQYAAVQSVRAQVAPTVMVLHYIDKPPRGVWYTQCQRHLSLHKVVAPVVRTSLGLHARRRLMELLLMLRALRKSGGTAFSDFNTFVVRDTLQHTLGLGTLVAGRAAATIEGDTSGAFGVAVHALQAPAQHPALQALENELLALIARDDRRLHDLSLEQLVGQLLASESAQSHGAGVVVTDSALFDALPMRTLPQLARVNDGAAAVARGVLSGGASALHIAKFDFVLQRNDTPGLRTVQELEQLSAEDALEGASSLHALLRFAAGLNTTAEIDALLDL